MMSKTTTKKWSSFLPSLFFFAFLVLDQPLGWCVESPREFKRLTPKHQNYNLDFGDPSPPDFSDPKVVRVYTTGGFVLSWRGNDPVGNFLNARPPSIQTMKLHHPDGREFQGDEDIWDPTMEDGIVYGSVMSPTQGRPYAIWPDDNWNRRTYAFKFKNQKWIREINPIFGPIPSRPTWIGHNYGHQFIEDEKGESYIFYEKVTEDLDQQPWKTELFARKMKSSVKAEEREIPILVWGAQIWPALRRSFGGTLAEGPRPFTHKGFYFISFSGGDYTSDDYGIHLLWSKSLEGPYLPYLNNRNADLKDFGYEIESRVPMVWGAGRASFFEAQGGWWAIFHGIEPHELQPHEDAKRVLYLAPVSIRTFNNTSPEVRILLKD